MEPESRDSAAVSADRRERIGADRDGRRPGRRRTVVRRARDAAGVDHGGGHGARDGVCRDADARIRTADGLRDRRCPRRDRRRAIGVRVANGELRAVLRRRRSLRREQRVRSTVSLCRRGERRSTGCRSRDFARAARRDRWRVLRAAARDRWRTSGRFARVYGFDARDGFAAADRGAVAARARGTGGGRCDLGGRNGTAVGYGRTATRVSRGDAGERGRIRRDESGHDGDAPQHARSRRSVAERYRVGDSESRAGDVRAVVVFGRADRARRRRANSRMRCARAARGDRHRSERSRRDALLVGARVGRHRLELSVRRRYGAAGRKLPAGGTLRRAGGERIQRVRRIGRCVAAGRHVDSRLGMERGAVVHRAVADRYRRGAVPIRLRDRDRRRPRPENRQASVSPSRRVAGA